MAVQITKDNFEKLLNSEKFLVVDFWAEWCGPCQILSPVIEELALEYKGKVIIGKINVDHSSDLSAKYGIQSVPTILFFKDRQLMDRHIGGTTKNIIKEKIRILLDS